MQRFDLILDSVNRPSADELLAFYARHGHRTTSSREKIARMIESTFVFVSARRNGELVGFARGVTDGLWGRVIECKLDPALQGPAFVSRTGARIEHDSNEIARDMALQVIDALRRHGVETIDAQAYGTEVDFCEELGFKKIRGVVALSLDGDATASVHREESIVGARRDAAELVGQIAR